MLLRAEFNMVFHIYMPQKFCGREHIIYAKIFDTNFLRQNLFTTKILREILYGNKRSNPVGIGCNSFFPQKPYL